MSNSPSQGKGSARRRENQSKIRENWDAIDWSKGRPQEKPAIERLKDLFENPPAGSRVLVERYHDGQTAEWVIPPLEEILRPGKYGPLAPEIVELASRDLTSKCADDQFWTKQRVFLHGDPLATDAENDLNEQMQDDDLRPY